MAVLSIPITKAGDAIEIDTDEIMDEAFPGDVLKEVLIQGLKVLLNRGMSKIVGEKTDASKAAALEIAQANLAKCREGKIRHSPGNKAKGVSGEVKTEAMRLARALVKDAIKREGKKKISHIPAKEITAAATALLNGEHGKAIIAQAETTIADRKEKEQGLQIDVGEIKVDPKLVAKAEAEKAAKRKETEARKAGKGVTQRKRAPSHEAHA